MLKQTKIFCFSLMLTFLWQMLSILINTKWHKEHLKIQLFIHLLDKYLLSIYYLILVIVLTTRNKMGTKINNCCNILLLIVSQGKSKQTNVINCVSYLEDYQIRKAPRAWLGYEEISRNSDTKLTPWERIESRKVKSRFDGMYHRRV